MLSKRNLTAIGLALSLVIFAAGCKKKVAPPAPPAAVQPPPPPPPPPPAAPTVTQFTAEPTSIERGQSSTLRWEVSGDTTNVSINEGVGVVQATGSHRVSPSDSTTYTLTATGPGGTRTATATVSVSAPPPPPPPPPPARTVTLEERLSGDVQDAYFDYDKSDIRAGCPRRPDPGCRRPQGDSQRFPQRFHRHRGPLRRSWQRRVQPRPGRSPRQLRQGLSPTDRRRRRPAQDRELRQGTSAMYGAERRVLAEEPPRPLRAGPVK